MDHYKDQTRAAFALYYLLLFICSMFVRYRIVINYYKLFLGKRVRCRPVLTENIFRNMNIFDDICYSFHTSHFQCGI